jgi:hypothetical protein
MMTNKEKEIAPLQVGDRVRLLEGASFHVGEVGTVTKADVPIARAYEVGWDSYGVIEVAVGGGLWSGHWSHVEKLRRDSEAI